MSRRTPLLITLTVALLMCNLRAAITGADKKNAYTRHDQLRASIHFNRRTLSKAYEQVGSRDPKWDDAALEFLDASGLMFSHYGIGRLYHPAGVMSYEQLEKLGKAAIEAGCDDPLVRYCYGAVLDDMKRKAEAKPILLQAADDLSKSKYPPNRISSAHKRAINHLHPERDSEEIARRGKEAWAAALRATTGRFESQDQRIMLSHIEDVPGNDVREQQRFYNELRKLPGADAWIVNMIGGNYHIKAAWASRGAGWANSVTDEGWRGFFANLKQARDCLAKAHELHPEYPEAATLMITVAMGGGEQINIDAREWFDKATTAQLDHLDAYSRYRNALLPRWGGSYKAMHDLAIECVKTDRYDTDVPHQYLATVYDIANDSGRTDSWAHEPTFQQAKAVLSRYSERHPSMRDSDDSHIVAIAWKAGKYADAKTHLDRVGDKLNTYFLESFTPLPKLAIEQVHAMAGPRGPKVSAAEAFVDRADVPGAVKAYDAILAMDANAPGAAYVRARRNELDLWNRADSNWVSLRPDRHLTGWYPSGNEWSVDDQGRLVCTYGKAKETFVIYPADLGRAYELKYRMEFDEAQRRKPYAGSVVAYAGPNARYGLYLGPLSDLCVKSGESYAEGFKGDIGNANDVHVIVWQNTITTIVNDKVVKKDYVIRRDVPAEGTYFGFGAFYAPAGAVARFSDMQIRHLKAPPAIPGE